MTTHSHVLSERYRIGSCIAATTFNRVYSATDSLTGRQVIVKAARQDSGTRQYSNLANEAAMLRALKRWGIPAPRYLHQSRHQQQSYLVMSKVPGETLEALTLQGRLSPTDVVCVITELCLAVELLHQCGYVHHDIKPANVVLQRNGVPVLIDWGSAAPISTTGTAYDTIAFTPDFASPEQMRGLALPENDTFALGKLIEALIAWPSPRLTLIIERATAPIARRYRSAAELWRELLRLRWIDRLVQWVGLTAI